MYVDDLNIVRTPEELTRIEKYLKKEFEIKNLGKTKKISRPVDQAFPH